MIRNSDKFENGCIPMHCGAWVHGDLTYLKFYTVSRKKAPPLSKVQ